MQRVTHPRQANSARPLIGLRADLGLSVLGFGPGSWLFRGPVRSSRVKIYVAGPLADIERDPAVQSAVLAAGRELALDWTRGADVPS